MRGTCEPVFGKARRRRSAASTSSKNSTPNPVTWAVFDAGLVLETDDHVLRFPQGSLSVSAYFFPGNPGGLPGQDSASASLDLLGPGLVDGGRILGALSVKAREQFGRKVSPFINGEVQGVTEHRLRS